MTNQTTTGYLGLDWGHADVNHYRYLSSFAPTAGNWYFIASAIAAGTPPTAKMWVGSAGVLTDVLAGVSRTTAGGNPTSTPNVTAAPLVLGNDGTGHIANATFGGMLVYNLALSKSDCDSLYQSFKIKMLERGITVQ
jgi:hypothetical protein